MAFSLQQSARQFNKVFGIIATLSAIKPKDPSIFWCRP